MSRKLIAALERFTVSSRMSDDTLDTLHDLLIIALAKVEFARRARTVGREMKPLKETVE
jgi:hypothetical protein